MSSSWPLQSGLGIILSLGIAVDNARHLEYSETKRTSVQKLTVNLFIVSSLI